MFCLLTLASVSSFLDRVPLCSTPLGIFILLTGLKSVSLNSLDLLKYLLYHLLCELIFFFFICCLTLICFTYRFSLHTFRPTIWSSKIYDLTLSFAQQRVRSTLCQHDSDIQQNFTNTGFPSPVHFSICSRCIDLQLFFLWSRCSTFEYLSPHSQAWILVENRYKPECSIEYLIYYCSLHACFHFLSPTGSLLPQRFMIFILNLILMMGFEESGVTAIFMFTSCCTWHYLLSYCLDDEYLSLTFFLYFDDSFILIFVAISFLRSSPGLTWTAQSTLSR